MDDDDRTAALFRAAASDAAPPAAFDHSDVVRASHRITARRRSALVAGGLALLVVAGVGTAVALPRDQETGAVSSVAAPEAARDAAGSAPQPGPPGADLSGTPLGPGTATCADRQDPALRALVEQVLPDVAGSAAAPVTFECRPGEERYLALQVDDGGVAGLLTVAYLPPGTAVSLVPDAVVAPTASGGSVVVGSTADQQGGPAPFASRLDGVTAFLAPRL